MRFVLVTAALFLGACGSPAKVATAPANTAPEAPAAAPAAAAAPKVEMAPAPYTPAQIRDASATGRRIVFKVEEPGKPDVKRVIEFTKSDATGAEVHSSTIDSSGRVLDSSNDHATWEELQSHGMFPKDKVDVKHRTISVPIGTLECQVYKVTGEGDEVTTFYFADTLPGPPVFYFTEKGGKRVKASTMESNAAGK